MKPLLIALLVIATCGNSLPFETKLREGDIIFQESRSTQSRAIQLATKSRYSHMGMLYRQNGAWFVYEAVQPVKLTPLGQWIERGRGGHFVVKRLRRSGLLTPAVLARMKSVGARYRGKPYDLYFEWTNQRLYCSELVWKIYREAAGVEIGHLEKLRDFDLSNPVVQAKLRERYGKRIPLEEPVISPSAMFDSDELMEVLRR